MGSWRARTFQILLSQRSAWSTMPRRPHGRTQIGRTPMASGGRRVDERPHSWSTVIAWSWPANVLLVSVLLLGCGRSRVFHGPHSADAGAAGEGAGGVAGIAGASSADSSGGAGDGVDSGRASEAGGAEGASQRPRPGGSGGHGAAPPAGEGAASGEAGALAGGAPAPGAGGAAGEAGAAGAQGTEGPPECTSDQDCADPTRPVCGAAGECVECVSPDDCPEPTSECLVRACRAGACTPTPKEPGAPCGSSSQTACDDPDGCDGAGQCLSHHRAEHTSCDDGLFCNGSDSCDGAGSCAHSGSPCASGQSCQEETKTCHCAEAGQPVAQAQYCDYPDEAADRSGASKASEQCADCGGYDRTLSGTCMIFTCKD